MLPPAPRACPAINTEIVMNFARLLGPALALLLLAAHFARATAWLPAVVSLALIGLLAVPRPWAARLLQAALVLGALEWVRTLWLLAAARAAAGTPWLRMALILGAVSLLTLASAWVFQLPAVRRRFRLG
jgi:hypothetical protein